MDFLEEIKFKCRNENFNLTTSERNYLENRILKEINSKVFTMNDEELLEYAIENEIITMEI